MRINYDKISVGPRSLKTVLAVFICILICFFTTKTNGMYGAMTTFICMLPTYEESKLVGRGRIVATIISFGAGFLVLSLYSIIPGYYTVARLFITPLVTLGLILLCRVINYERSMVLCCTLFIMLSLNESYSRENILESVVVRLIETIIGVVVALLINKYILPYDGGEDEETVQEEDKAETEAEQIERS